jgi:hypothetical protein
MVDAVDILLGDFAGSKIRRIIRQIDGDPAGTDRGTDRPAGDR